jgi:hypothetical protein
MDFSSAVSALVRPGKSGRLWVLLMVLSSGLLGFVIYGATIVAVDADEPVDAGGSVDYIGAYLGVGGLILFNFVRK